MSLFQLVTHGTAGDVLPFLRIGAVLRSRGHDVVLVSHAPYRAAAARAGLQFVPLEATDRYQEHLAGTPDLLNARSPGDIADFYRREGLFGQVQFEVETQLGRHRPRDTVYVGRHTSGASTLFAAEATGAPAVWVAVAPAQLMVAPLAAANCQQALGASLNQVRGELGLPAIADWVRWFGSAALTVGLWPEWFDRAGVPAPGSVRLTDFVLGDDEDPPPLPPAAARMLAADRPPILLTGGTGRLLHPDFYPAAVAAVLATGRDGLLVVPHRDLVPDPLPPQVRWFAQLPFPAVLPRVAALLHHGGIGTAVRALRSGTPQVMMANGADRPDNGQRLARHGLAAWSPLPRWTPDRLAGQLTEVMAQTELRARASALAGGGDPGPGAAADALESALQAGPVRR